MLDRLLFRRIDNAPLIIFRVLFGVLCALESYGAIITGWVRRTLVEPRFTFSFIGFEWLQPLPGNGMYVYFFVMGTFGVLIALGYKYRFSIIAFTLMWTAVYLMQKTSYNNHYYLLILVSGFMVFFPANRYFSLDAKRNPSIKKISMPSWVKWAVVLQLFIVYTYASIAKMYGDWLDFGIIKILMQDKANYPIIGDLLQQPWVHKAVGVFGILFDLLVVPALLWKPTRKIALIASIFFHLFNSIVFQIGIFPYLSLAFIVFFFEPETIRNIFFKKKSFYNEGNIEVPSYKNSLLAALGLYFLIQLMLPVRHHFIADDVLWTEEGHRLSWRMMLRSRSGKIQFKVRNNETGKTEWINTKDYLTPKQNRRIGAYPDFIWQFAQYLKKEYAKKGIPVSVYALNAKVSVNGKPYRAFIDPQIDLANTAWDHLRHNAFILPSSVDDPVQN
ncbi:HTTM domain-containing protein [Flavobacteriaceae bacterium TP-CH-4]|uniref:HTTM domain-containing protein n=1 Tax=Pelagihabitans pacificus TaxID=2696054 RepID=A0A967AUI7_9FLAO|nr:HTTM domain-containing protein [Pelagihabitans pacificus]NHF60636.1 HTTM domain-containing protein [Pelagihabitans pacificus]